MGARRGSQMVSDKPAIGERRLYHLSSMTDKGAKELKTFLKYEAAASFTWDGAVMRLPLWRTWVTPSNWITFSHTELIIGLRSLISRSSLRLRLDWSFSFSSFEICLCRSFCNLISEILLMCIVNRDESWWSSWMLLYVSWSWAVYWLRFCISLFIFLRARESGSGLTFCFLAVKLGSIGRQDREVLRSVLYTKEAIGSRSEGIDAFDTRSCSDNQSESELRERLYLVMCSSEVFLVLIEQKFWSLCREGVVNKGTGSTIAIPIWWWSRRKSKELRYIHEWIRFSTKFEEIYDRSILDSESPDAVGWLCVKAISSRCRTLHASWRLRPSELIWIDRRKEFSAEGFWGLIFPLV